MRLELKQRDKRALFLMGLAVALYLSLTQIAFPAFDSLKLAADEAANKEDQLRKYRRALERKGRYTQLIPGARQQIRAAETVLIRGDNVSQATAELQALVEDIIKTSQVNVVQRSVSGPKKIDEFYNELTMTMSFDATPSELVNFLTGLRTSPKFLTVRAIQVAPMQPLNEAPKTGEYKKIVRVSITVAVIQPVKAA